MGQRLDLRPKSGGHSRDNQKHMNPYDKIEDNLFLGNIKAANNRMLLERLDIKRVLTLRHCGITEENRLANIEYLHISVNDTKNDDILTHFKDCHQFIEESQKNGHNILVHCKKGRSRSVTVVVSYLMFKYGIHFEEAFDRVKNKRLNIRPNSSFVYQLKLFDEMNYTFNALNPKFRHFLLKRWIFVWKRRIIDSKDETDMTIIDNYSLLLPVSHRVKGIPFSCKECKTVLFGEINVVKDLSKDSSHYQCPNVFTEPIKWMSNQIHETTDGSISCPKCQCIVGTFNWRQMDCKCVVHQKLKSLLVFNFIADKLSQAIH